MLYIFSAAIGLFIATLFASLFIRTRSRLLAIMLLVSGAASLVSAMGLLLSRVLGQQAGFLQPWCFILLIIPLLVFAVGTIFRRDIMPKINYSLTHLEIEQSSLRLLFTRWAPLLFYTATLCLLVIALARPVKIERSTLPPTEGIDIMLLLDVSASMNSDDFYPTRFVAALKTADDFISKRPSDRIGLVLFSTEAMLQAPLTLDHEALRDFLSSLYLGIIPPQSTAIGNGLAVAAQHIKDSKAKSKIIILLTDGRSNAGSIMPTIAAKAAAAYGIKVYTIGMASLPENPSDKDADEINENLMQEIALLTGGRFYRAQNEMELANIYKTIDQLEKTEFNQASMITQIDFYYPFLLAALVLLFVGLILDKLLFIKVP